MVALVLNTSDYISIAGTALTLAGLGVTMYQILKTKSVAESARQSAEDTRQKVNRILSVSDLSRLGENVSLIKNYLKQKDYRRAAERLESIRVTLIELRESPVSSFISADIINDHIKQLGIYSVTFDTFSPTEGEPYDAHDIYNYMLSLIEFIKSLEAKLKHNDNNAS